MAGLEFCVSSKSLVAEACPSAAKTRGSKCLRRSILKFLPSISLLDQGDYYQKQVLLDPLQTIFDFPFTADQISADMESQSFLTFLISMLRLPSEQVTGFRIASAYWLMESATEQRKAKEPQ